jgi:hypothetical protein
MNNNAIIIQKYFRRYRNNKNLSKSKDNMTLDILNKLLDNYIKSNDLIEELNKLLNNKKIRNQNFPSENIVKFAFVKKYKIMPTWDTTKGDLAILTKK